MKKRSFWLLAIFLFSISISACNRKAGCPAYESAGAKTNRKGELSTKSGKSQLFPQKMRKG